MAVRIIRLRRSYMYYSFIWLALVVILALIEAITAGLTVIWFAIGAVFALICAALSGPIWLQIVLFVVISLICLLLVRPLAKKNLKGKTVATNADAVIGKEAKVTEDIDNISGKGAVSVGGIIWSARSVDGSEISSGSNVKIVRIEGVKVFVEPV